MPSLNLRSAVLIIIVYEYFLINVCKLGNLAIDILLKVLIILGLRNILSKIGYRE